MQAIARKHTTFVIVKRQDKHFTELNSTSSFHRLFATEICLGLALKACRKVVFHNCPIKTSFQVSDRQRLRLAQKGWLAHQASTQT